MTGYFFTIYASLAYVLPHFLNQAKKINFEY